MATSTTGARARFLVVEDDIGVAQGYERFIRRYADVQIARAIREAEALLASHEWSGIVLDVHLPDGSGLDFLPRVRAHSRTVPVLVATGLLDTNIANHCHLHHASCVYKPDVGPNLGAFLGRAVARHESARARVAEAVRAYAQATALSRREAEVVEMVALGISRERLAAEMGVSENTIKSTIRRLLAKCGEPRVEGVARSVLEQIVRREETAA